MNPSNTTTACVASSRLPASRAYFWTVYSLRRRLGEGLRLQVGDINSSRMLLHIHRGKGTKDRYVLLPSSTLKILREHWATHRHPRWLFPATGRDHQQATHATGPMDRCSALGAMRRVVQELNFQKAISIHALRTRIHQGWRSVFAHSEPSELGVRWHRVRSALATTPA
jgi:integrase